MRRRKADSSSEYKARRTRENDSKKKQEAKAVAEGKATARYANRNVLFDGLFDEAEETTKDRRKIEIDADTIDAVFSNLDEVEDDIEELAECLRLDMNSLQVEASLQPEFYEKAGRISADLKYQAKNAKNILDRAKAGISLDVRSNPEDYDLEKITEGSINSTVMADDRIVKASKVLFEIERLSDRASSLIVAIDSRRSMLKVEAELFTANYWNTDAPVSSKTMEASRAQATADILNKRKRKKEK